MFINGTSNIIYNHVASDIMVALSAVWPPVLPVEAQTLKQANAATCAYFNDARRQEIRYGGRPDVYPRDTWRTNHKEA